MRQKSDILSTKADQLEWRRSKVLKKTDVKKFKEAIDDIYMD